MIVNKNNTRLIFLSGQDLQASQPGIATSCMESDGEDANAARREPAAEVARVDGVELNKKAAAAESGICKGMPFANRGESEPPPTLLEDGKAGNDGEEHCDSEEWLATACVEAKDDEAENNSALEAQGIKALWGEPDSPPPWALHELQQDIQWWCVCVCSAKEVQPAKVPVRTYISVSMRTCVCVLIFKLTGFYWYSVLGTVVCLFSRIFLAIG